MAEAEATSSSGGTARRFLTFRIETRLYAVGVDDVVEIIRRPRFARVPQGPECLLGLANLRGAILPVASLRALLGAAEDTAADVRALVLNGTSPVALTVDAVDALIAVQPGQIETRQAELGAGPHEILRGAFTTERAEVAKILDIPALLDAAFTQRSQARKSLAKSADVRAAAEKSRVNDDRQRLITFDVARQEYALPLEAVREVIPAPDIVTLIPRSEDIVLGVASYRQTILPLLSLRALLGFMQPEAPSGREKVVVSLVGDVLVGLVVDGMRLIVSADRSQIEETPEVLAVRSGGEATIRAIYRGDEGRRLISILAPEHLFREDVMKRLRADHGAAAGAGKEADDKMERKMSQFLVFRLGDDEFGLPIEAVDEVTELPAQVARVPKTPKFLEGVVNLRGDVVPVVDQRKRFGMPKAENGDKRRLIVVRTDRHRAGLIVDSVSEVLRSPADSVEPPPDLTEDSSRLILGVINLESNGRIILVLEPGELLTRAERGLLDAFESKSGRAQ